MQMKFQQQASNLPLLLFVDVTVIIIATTIWNIKRFSRQIGYIEIYSML